MKRLMIVLMGMIMFFGLNAWAEDVRYEIYEFDLVASGVTRDTTVDLTVNGSAYLDMKLVKPGLGVFSISPYYIQVDPAGVTESGTTITPSGTSITVNYSVTNVPNPNSSDWYDSGTTNIIGPTSGTTNLRGMHWVFTPEFGLKYRFQVTNGCDSVNSDSGLTAFKCKLAIQ